MNSILHQDANARVTLRDYDPANFRLFALTCMQVDADKQKCLEALVGSVQGLGALARPEQLEPIADLIIQSMTGPWRSFHTPQHIFQVGEGGDEVEVISALFHDMVYVQVDGGINLNMMRSIAPFIREVDQQIILADDVSLLADSAFKLSLSLFGFQLGQKLHPMAGQNEFLSALLAAKVLEGILPLSVIAQVVACIEATIPFRAPDASGKTCSDTLFESLRRVSQEHGFGWSDEETHALVRRAVRLSNRDVENFASEQATHFLDNTWNLIPETNHDLRRASHYTAKGYRVSLQKMEGFLNFLKAEVVFRQYGSEPSDEHFSLLLSRARRNLEIARLYLGMKLTSIAVLEALSLRIGREVSVSMMMGERPLEGQPSAGLESFLPPVEQPVASVGEVEEAVLTILEQGRTVASDYDVRNSPIATFMTKSVGFSVMRQLLVMARAFFKGEVSAEDFLASAPKTLIDSLVDAFVRLSDVRRESLLGN